MVLLGMDEVGRGSWAGPVVVGAVILGPEIPGLRDSKLLSVKSREKLDTTIRETARAVRLGQASPQEIDQLGLTRALCLAYERALVQISAAFDEIIIDGTYNFLSPELHVRTLVHGDQLIPAVSAASIVAKAARDRLMTELAAAHPGYGFESHVGYGTAKHAAALRALGVSPIHRRSFAPVQSILRIQP